MAQAIRMFFMVLIFAMISIIQWNLDADRTGTRILKNALELAVHDASLALDESQLGQGNIVFDQVQAEINFRESLMFHLKVNGDYEPNEGSFFQDPIEIKELTFIDDQTLDPHSASAYVEFPYVYRDSNYEVVDILYGPSVIAVVETKSPRYFAGEKGVLRQASVYEYFY